MVTRIPAGRRRGRAAVLIGLAALALAAGLWTWAVPALIVGQVRAHYRGKVTLRGWWLGARSAGLIGLTLHEGPEANSPVWATFPTISTDMSVSGLLRGRFAPRRVTLGAPRVAVRLDSEARPLTRIPWKAGPASGSTRLPALEVVDARVTFAQQGRPDLVLSGIDARMDTDRSGGGRLSAKADESTWGRWAAAGEFAPAFRSGQVRLTGRGVVASREMEAGIPFVPGKVWQAVVARGPVDLRIVIGLAPGTAQPVRVRTAVTLNRTALSLPAFGLEATDATGEVVVEDGVVRLDHVTGRAIGGDLRADGALDFAHPDPRFDLAVALNGVNAADAPPSWHLDRFGVEGGRLTGSAHLKMVLEPDGADLTGSTGDATITGGTLHGIPVKAVRLVLRGESADGRHGRVVLAPADPALARAGYQPAAGKKDPALKLPRSFSTEIDLENVELSRIVAKAKALGIVLPFEVAGRFSLKATATIPLGTLRDLKGYVFHGHAVLSGASIAGVDLGRATARVDMDDGVLEIREFQGQLVDRPDGGSANRPEPTAPIAADGPLPPGAFRGRLRAALAPPGPLSARFEADRLPLGELAAPVLPRPTPLSGLVSLDVTVGAAVDALRDPRAWTAVGAIRSESIRFRETILDTVSSRFTLGAGRLAISELSAKLEGRPLSANLDADLAPPYGYSGKLDVAGWDLADLLALVPGLPRPAPAGGLLTVRADAKGTLSPWTVETKGRGRLERFRAGPVPVGDLPFRWSTGPDAVVIDGISAQVLGGVFTAEGLVPTRPGRPAEATVTLLGLDAARLAEALPGKGLELTGKADVRVTLVAPLTQTRDDADLTADVRVSAPDLTFMKVPTRSARGSLSLRKGVVRYEFLAETLDGRVEFRGDLALAAALAGTTAPRAKLQAGWFSLARVWKTEGVTGRLKDLDGICAVGVNLTLPADASRRSAQALGELRGLRWEGHPVGSFRAAAAISPTTWRVMPLTGDLMGSAVRGDLWGEVNGVGPALRGFKVSVERFELSRLATLFPGIPHVRDLSGFATVRLDGLPEKVKGEARLEQGRAFGIALADVRLPAELVYDAASGIGTLAVRESTGRLAGGLVRGDARLRFGATEDFRVDLHVNNVDLRSFRKPAPDERNPLTGKITGRLRLESPAARQPRKIRGKVHLDLTDASLFELPVFRQIDQFLGSDRGGLFEAGELDLTIADGKVRIKKLALVGRLIQLRAQGTVGFDAQLDLQVIIKPNQVIPQTGRALASAVLSLGRPRGDDEKVLRTANPLSDGPVKLRVSGGLADPKLRSDPSINFDEDEN